MRLGSYLKKPIVLVLLSLAVCVVYLNRLRTALAQRPTAYTVYDTTYMTDNGGGRMVINHVRARRSDAAHATQTIAGAPSGSVVITTVISDPSTRLRIKWNNVTRKKITTYLSDNDIAALSRQYTSPTCADVYELPKALADKYVLNGRPQLVGMGKVAGFDVAEYSRVDERAVWTWFYAPSVNCLQLKQTQQWKDTKGGITDSEATQVVLGEPTPSLFTVPPDILETMPSVYEEQLFQLRSKNPMPADMQNRMMREDGLYRESRIHARQNHIQLPEPMR